MNKRLLVVTTVHQPDDARIRSKLIVTLASEWEITYATRVPGPTDTRGITWLPLRGNRFRRWMKAATTMISSRWALVAIHDPELLPAGILRSILGRPTLFDLHENLPAQIDHKTWIPSVLRPLLRRLAARMLRWAESTMTVTLAEAGYGKLFKSSHEVLENYLVFDDFMDPAPASADRFFAYVGDITRQRGAFLALEAAAGAGVGLVMVGRVSPPDLARDLSVRADELGTKLELTGPLPHADAMKRIAGALAGLSPLDDVENYRHSLPTKILEYLALGLPVLASDLAGTRAVADGAPGVKFVAPGDADAWFRAGAALANEPDLREAAAEGADAIKRRFGWPAGRVLSVYRAAARG